MTAPLPNTQAKTEAGAATEATVPLIRLAALRLHAPLKTDDLPADVRCKAAVRPKAG